MAVYTEVYCTDYTHSVPKISEEDTIYALVHSVELHSIWLHTGIDYNVSDAAPVVIRSRLLRVW